MPLNDLVAIGTPGERSISLPQPSNEKRNNYDAQTAKNDLMLPGDDFDLHFLPTTRPVSAPVSAEDTSSQAAFQNDEEFPTTRSSALDRAALVSARSHRCPSPTSDPFFLKAFCPPEPREAVLSLISNHFNMHPSLPIPATQGFVSLNSITIRQPTRFQMYLFCHQRNLPDVWAYMYQG